MEKTYNIVVAGPESLVGESILGLLEEREFPVGNLRLISDEAGGRAEFKGKRLKVEPLDAVDFSDFDLAFFCLDEALAEEYAPRAAAAGCVVIDDSPCFRLEDDVPLVVAEVNPEALAGYEQQHIVANPGSGPAMLSIALRPLTALGIKRVNVVTMQAASGRDKSGVEELARQSTAMFNMKPIESKVFSQQLAFNLIPQIGELMDDGYSREEAKLSWESAKILDQADLPLSASCVRVPVFHGHALSVQVELEQDISQEALLDLFDQAAGLTLMQDEVPTPVADAVGQDTVFVGRVRKDSSAANSVVFWLVGDNVRRGAALNSVQSAEILIKQYLITPRMGG